jgi:AcrR family transcriptional regulator
MVNRDSGHPSPRRSQAERRANTREALLVAGRQLFSQRGFAATTQEEIVERAGVTRGALHHHFGRKEDLFRAVFEQLEDELVQHIATIALAHRDPMDQLRTGCEAFLDAATDPAFQRIVLVDAPAVLGWETWREVDAQYGLGLVVQGLQGAMQSGQMEARPVEPLAHLVLAALNEAALLVASADDPPATRLEVGELISHLLTRL